LVLNRYSNLIFEVPIGGLLLGVGMYWLWRFHTIRRREPIGRDPGPGGT
jgi:hypothetical protein